MKFKLLSHVTALALSVSMLASCGQKRFDAVGSKIKVTNGTEISTEEFPGVVLLYDAKIGSICTGSFITETIVLTAAHCTMGGEIDSDGDVDHELQLVEIEDNDKSKARVVATSTRVVRNPLWDFAGRNVNRYDLGVVFFEPGVAKEILPIASEPAKVGDDFVIVGYGLNTSSSKDPSSAGIKRMGQNRVSAIQEGFIQFDGKSKTTSADGTDVAAGSGDSGGPLFIEGQIAGVTSGGGWGGFGRTVSLYIDLHSSTSRDFLEQFVSY